MAKSLPNMFIQTPGQILILLDLSNVKIGAINFFENQLTFHIFWKYSAVFGPISKVRPVLESGDQGRIFGIEKTFKSGLFIFDL